MSNKRYPCNCKNCKSDFKGSAPNKMFCSEECEYLYRAKNQINQGRCLFCHKELSLKQLKKGTKFCNNSCSSSYNNSKRTEEVKQRISEICRKSQKNIMSNPEEIKKRIKKRLETINSWEEDKKLQHSETLSKNTKKYFQDQNKREIISNRVKNYWANITKKDLEQRARKNKETRAAWTEEKKNEIKKKTASSIRKRTLENLSNIENLNKEYCLEHFVKKDRFLFDEFREYFKIAKSLGYKIKAELGIEIQNKITISKPQEDLFNFIRVDISEKKFNDRTFIKPLELDILIKSKKLAIEYNGLYHHSSNGSSPKDKKYHLTKTELVEQKGYQLLQIFSSDNIDIWKSLINNKLGLNKRIFARKCIIKEVKPEETRKFLEENHLQGDCNSKIRLGLYYEENLVSLMTFGKSRYNKNIDYELIRFCSLKGYNVVGGASKLLSHFRKQYSGSIISYANRRWSNGDLYRKLGFKEIGQTPPNYFYFNNDFEIHSRIAFQKHKLKDKLMNFDPDLTEEQNMFNNGYNKIYDCGNKVFVLNSL